MSTSSEDHTNNKLLILVEDNEELKKSIEQRDTLIEVLTKEINNLKEALRESVKNR